MTRNCKGIEIEPGKFSGCDAGQTGAWDCPACGAYDDIEAEKIRPSASTPPNTWTHLELRIWRTALRWRHQRDAMASRKGGAA